MNKKSAILDKYLLTNNTTESTKTNYCRQIEENQIENTHGCSVHKLYDFITNDKNANYFV